MGRARSNLRYRRVRRDDEPALVREIKRLARRHPRYGYRGIHAMLLRRGNFRSSWIAQGGYEPVAELLFHEIGVDGYFLEYDTERAGGFEPLRLVPKGKAVVLGVVTSKTGALESVEYLGRRVDEAARFVDLEQLCLSPQCGFASTEEGNALTEYEQWAKLARIVEVAAKVWGG